MPIIIKDLEHLQKELSSRIQKAMELTKNEIFDVVSRKVFKYYNDPVFDGNSTEPRDYDRTGKLMESLTASHITSTKDGFQFTVGWDDDYLIFTYPGWNIQYGRGLSGKNAATGLDVLNYMAEGYHGGYSFFGGHKFWDESLNELGGKSGILNMFERNLRLCGVPLK